MSSLAPACGALQLAAPQTASAAQVGGLLCFSALTPPVASARERVDIGAWAGVAGTGLTQAQLLARCSRTLSSCYHPSAWPQT